RRRGPPAELPRAAGRRFVRTRGQADVAFSAGRAAAGVNGGLEMPREALLVRTLVEMADNFVDEFDVVALLSLLADRCVDVLDVVAAGVMLAAPEGELRVVASSSEAMRV